MKNTPLRPDTLLLQHTISDINQNDKSYNDDDTPLNFDKVFKGVSNKFHSFFNQNDKSWIFQIHKAQ